MKIKLSPVRIDTTPIKASVDGDSIFVNGIEYDFGPLANGSTLLNEAIPDGVFTGNVERIDGEIHLTLLLPHGHSAPSETRFPEFFDKYMTVVNGDVPLPPYGGEQ